MVFKFVGALAYADDVLIITPTNFAMRKMLGICEKYAHEYSIVFNANKSKWMLVTPHSLRKIHDYISRCPFYNIGNERIEKVESFLHLSHVVISQHNDDNDDDIHTRRRNFIGQVNYMLCVFQ